MKIREKLRLTKLCALATVAGVLLCGGSAHSQPVGQAAPPRPGEPFYRAFMAGVQQNRAKVEADPASVAGHAALAESYVSLWCFGLVPREEAMPQAREAAARALALSPDASESLVAIGVVELCDWNWAGAGGALQRAVENDPESAKARQWWAMYLAAMGRHEEAVRQAERAIELQPGAGMETVLGAVLYFGRDWERLREVMQGVVDKQPRFSPGYDWLGMSLVQLKRYDEALGVYRQAVDYSSRLAEMLGGYGHAYAAAGQEEGARRVLAELESLGTHYYIPPVQVAYVHVGLGQDDRAFELLDQAYAEKSWELVYARVEPWFDPVRGDERFREMIERMDFPTDGELREHDRAE